VSGGLGLTHIYILRTSWLFNALVVNFQSLTSEALEVLLVTFGLRQCMSYGLAMRSP